MINVCITGSDGFIAKNFLEQLNKFNFKILKINKKTSKKSFEKIILQSHIIYHFAGRNRPINKKKFYENNYLLTKKITDLLIIHKKNTKIVFLSSIHVLKKNSYGESKKLAEKNISFYSKKCKAECYVFRLPHVAGKWCKPNYNSVIATIFYNVSRNIKMNIFGKKNILSIIYINDLIKIFLNILLNKNTSRGFYKLIKPRPIYKLSVENLFKIACRFYYLNKNLDTPECLENSVEKILYSIYLTYIPKKNRFYNINSYEDKRGKFVEFMKSKNAGQISYFTAQRGITRGLHVHTRKSEKFLILQGKALYTTLDLETDSISKKIISDQDNLVIQTIPGVAHKIKNIGKNNLIVLVWANENFSKKYPDTRFLEF